MSWALVITVWLWNGMPYQASKVMAANITQPDCMMRLERMEQVKANRNDVTTKIECVPRRDI